jgi:hypothetical protein
MMTISCKNESYIELVHNQEAALQNLWLQKNISWDIIIIITFFLIYHFIYNLYQYIQQML